MTSAAADTSAMSPRPRSEMCSASSASATEAPITSKRARRRAPGCSARRDAPSARRSSCSGCRRTAAARSRPGASRSPPRRAARAAAGRLPGGGTPHRRGVRDLVRDARSRGPCTAAVARAIVRCRLGDESARGGTSCRSRSPRRRSRRGGLVASDGQVSPKARIRPTTPSRAVLQDPRTARATTGSASAERAACEPRRRSRFRSRRG